MSFLSTIFPSSSGTSRNAGAGQSSAQPAVQQAAPVINPLVLAAATAAQVAQDAAAATAAAAASASPLDKLAGLWDTPTTKDGKPLVSAPDPLTQPVFNFDPAKITASAATMDFTQGMDPTKVAAALGGDAAAFAEVLNHAVRNAVVGVTVNSGNLINQALLTNNANVAASIPSHIKQNQLLTFQDENPVMSHPAVAPLVNSLKQMAATKNPNASAAEIHKQIAEYMSGLSAALTAETPAAKAATAAVPKEMDWSTFA